MMSEEWRVIDGYENYAVSDQGRIKRLKSNNNAVAGRLLEIHIASTGYPMVNLLSSGCRKHVSVHRLVAKAFIPATTDATEVNHIDSNRANNHVSNLEWVTSSSNRLHAYASGGLCAQGEQNGYSKLTECGVREIRSHPSMPPSLQLVLSRKLGVSRATVRDVRARRTWDHVA